MKRTKVAILIAALCGPLGCDEQGEPSIGAGAETSQSDLFWTKDGILSSDPNVPFYESVCLANGSSKPQMTSYKDTSACVDVQYAKFVEGNPVVAAPCSGNDSLDNVAQKWTVVADPSGNGTINIKAGGMCLDVLYGQGPTVDIAGCNGTPAQQWTPKASGDNMNVVRLSNAATNPNQCLELPASYTPGNPVQLVVGNCLDYDAGVPGCTMDCKVCPPNITPGDLETCKKADDLRKNHNQQRWRLPDMQFPVEAQNHLRDAIANSWAAVSRLVVPYWGACESLSDQDKTQLVELHYRVGATGMGQASDLSPKAHKRIDMNVEGEESDRGMIVHEFGHVLGFLHEQGRFENRPNADAGYPNGFYCQHFQGDGWDSEGGHAGATGTSGVFDPQSVDNYCNSNLTNGGTEQNWMLSRNDIVGAQMNYGARNNYRQSRWSSGTGRSTDHKPRSGSDSLSVGGRWYSPDGVVALTLEADGQLAVIRTDLPVVPRSGNLPTEFAPLWVSGTKDPYSPASPVAQFGTNGILQVYDTKAKKIVWQSTTTSYPGATLSIRQDGDVVITTTSGTPATRTTRWHTGTAHRSELDGATGLIPGATLAAGSSKPTSKGNFKLSMDTSGNLSVYQNGTKLWSKGYKDGKGVPAQGAKMMLDGRFCLVDAKSACVSTISSYQAPGNFLALQEDGNLVVYEPAKFLIWKAGGTSRDHGVIAGFQSTNPVEPVVLWNGMSLHPGDTYLTAKGWAMLTMQADGNLVVYANYGSPTSPVWRATWSSLYDSGKMVAGDFATLSPDRDSSGNILPGGGALRVGQSTGTPSYDSNTGGIKNTYLTIDDEGYIFIYRVMTTGADSIGFAY